MDSTKTTKTEKINELMAARPSGVVRFARLLKNKTEKASSLKARAC